MERIAAVLLFLVLVGCAAPEHLCVAGICSDLQRDSDDLNSRATTKRLCAEGARTTACFEHGQVNT